MHNYRISQQYQKACGTNYSANGYPTRIATKTMPSGDGVIPCGQGGYETVSHITILPFGTGSDNNTFGMKVLGWKQTNIPTTPGVLSLWIPHELITFALTLSAAVGVSGTQIGSTQRFADTITSTGGPTFITSGALPIIDDWFQCSPAGDIPGVIKQPTFGFQLLELIFTTGGVATDCNALWSKG